MEGIFEYDKLFDATKALTRNLDSIVEFTSCGSISTYTENWRTRAIGINLQGLADTMIALGIAMESCQAKELNLAIAETVYYAALEASCDLADTKGRCSNWDGSPGSEGYLQYDLWDVVPTTRYDWDSLKHRIREHGLRNLLLISLYPIPASYNTSDVSAGTDPVHR